MPWNLSKLPPRQSPGLFETTKLDNDMTTITYTTKGSVRGCCGHKHQTINAAAKCLKADQSGCASQGGYSDRRIVRTDGEDMTNEEIDAEYDVFSR